jgi:hypothetical protein
MIGVVVRQDDGVETLESPSMFAHCDLCAFSTIDQDERAFDPDENAGQPAIRKRHHGASAEEQQIDHENEILPGH